MNKRGTSLLTLEIKRIIRYHEQFYANKMENLDEMETFLETNKLPKLTQEEIKCKDLEQLKKLT